MQLRLTPTDRKHKEIPIKRKAVDVKMVDG
jgi:hypothetical protein